MKYRLGIYIPTLDIGGGQQVAVLLANQIAQAYPHIEVVLFLFQKEATNYYIDPAVKVQSLGITVYHPNFLRRTGSFINKAVRLAPYLKNSEMRMDAIISILFNSNTVLLAAKTLQPQTTTRLIVSEQTTIGNALPFSRKNYLRVSWLRRWFYPQATSVVAASEGVAEELRGLSKNLKVQTIYNPLDLKTIDAQSQIPLPDWVKFDYIVGVGRYHNQKGFDWLIQALVQLPQDIHLVLVGDGPERESLTQLAKNLSLEDRVHLVGFDTNPFRWMKRSRCFVLSSRYEGFGIVVAEALAVGVPVVSMNCPFGPEEILQQGKVGELVKLGDVDGMAAAIQRVLEADESENKVMRQQRAADFAVDKIAEAYLRLALPEAINQ